MTEVTKIVPKPYLIESLVNAEHWSWPKALAEFVDNSFGEAAGAAQNVLITIDRNSVVVQDDGRGIDELHQCFVLGDSTSRYSTTDIGRYGVGSKHASVWMGKHYKVETTRAGLRRSWQINWDALRKGDDWPEFRPKQVIAPPRKQGTIITISGIWPGRKRPVADHISRTLGEIFAPALMAERRITLVDKRRKGSPLSLAIEPWRPKGLSDVVELKGSVGGRKYEAEIGILSNQFSGDAGLRVCFAHRVIATLRTLNDKAIPIRIFGYIRLAPEWKNRLSANKGEVVDAHDLEEHIAEHPDVKKVFALAEEYHDTMLIEGILSRVQALLNNALSHAPDGDETGAREPSSSAGTKVPNPSPPLVPPNPNNNVPAELSENSGLQLQIARLGQHIIGEVKEDNSICVVLNRDAPLVEAALQEAQSRPRGYYPALMAVVGSILSCHARRQDPRWLESRLGIRELCAGDQSSEIERLLRWWYFEIASATEKAGDDD